MRVLIVCKDGQHETSRLTSAGWTQQKVIKRAVKKNVFLVKQPPQHQNQFSTVATWLSCQPGLIVNLGMTIFDRYANMEKISVSVFVEPYLCSL